MMMTDGPCSNNQMLCTSSLEPQCLKLNALSKNSQPLAPATVALKAALSRKRVPHKAARSLSHGSKHPRKRVRFEEQRNTTAISPSNEGEAELSSSSSWYHPREYRSFQWEARNTILVFFQAGKDPFLLDPTQHCIRGLEKHQFPPQARALYKAQNRQFIRLIIGEHFRLRKAQVTDAEQQLHAMSTMYTVPAKKYARHLAQTD